MELGLSILPVKIYLVVYNPADSAAHVSLADSSSDVEEEDALPPRTLPAHLDITPANAAYVSPNCLSIVVSRMPQRSLCEDVHRK